jgi:type VI secretion system protein VasJ
MAEFIDSLQEKTARLRAPIAGPAPAGNDVTFDPDFERLKAEIDKLTSLSGGSVNWREVDGLASEILASKAKDFRVAAWLAAAKMQGGFAGFAEGLEVVRALIDDYWTTMYPDAKRARARANMVTWLVDGAVTFFDPRDVAPADADAVRACDTLIGAIDSALAERLGDLHPGLNKLRSTFRNKVRAIPAAAPAPTPAAPPTAAQEVAPVVAPPTVPTAPQPPPAPIPVATPAAAIKVDVPSATNAQEATAALRKCRDGILQVAQLLRKADPARPWPYFLTRTALWLIVEEAPPATAGKTKLPAPAADLKRRVALAFEQQRWLDLLTLAEDSAANYLFWLDLHRMIAVAMDALGALFLDARETVGRQVVAFVRRVPTLVDLSFADGSPFADAATRSWLEAEILKHGGGGAVAASTTVSEEDAEIARRFDEARGFVTTGKVVEGLALAGQLANRGADARTRFRSRLLVAQLAIEGGKPEVARPLLESLVQEIELHALDTWEPDLSVAVYTALLSVLGGSKGPEATSRQTHIFDRLCRLNPAAALRIGA